jgi:hypothetical protein
MIFIKSIRKIPYHRLIEQSKEIPEKVPVENAHNAL